MLSFPTSQLTRPGQVAIKHPFQSMVRIRMTAFPHYFRQSVNDITYLQNCIKGSAKMSITFVSPSVSSRFRFEFKLVMKKILTFIILITALCSCKETALQRADNDFDVLVKTPEFKTNKPVILFDEGHNNFHTTHGLYQPFANLVQNDGYNLKTLTTPVSEELLSSANIYVIANAKGKGEVNDTPAFTEDECEIIKNWVINGGSLLLIADHFPFGSAVENLGSKLGINFQKGIVQDSLYYDKKSNDQSQLEFSKDNKLLGEHTITDGVNKVITFTGQSIKCKDSSCISFLILSDAAYDMTPNAKVTKDGDDTRVEVVYDNPQSAEGRSQGVAITLGKGKVVCLGEAAMLTAQKNRDNSKVGMNYNPDNKIIALNIMHWLTKKE